MAAPLALNDAHAEFAKFSAEFAKCIGVPMAVSKNGGGIGDAVLLCGGAARGSEVDANV
jgi:hypothetical protein